MDANSKKAWADVFDDPEYSDIPVANLVLSMRLTPGATRLFNPTKLSDENVINFSMGRIGSLPSMGRHMQNLHQLMILKPAPWAEPSRRRPRTWAVKLGKSSSSLHVTGIQKVEEVAYLLNYLVDLLKLMAPAGGDESLVIRVTDFKVCNIHASYCMGQPENMHLSLDDVCTDLSSGAVIQLNDPLVRSLELKPTTKAVVNAIFSEKQHKTYTGFTFKATLISGAGTSLGTSSVTIFGSGSMLINGKCSTPIATVAYAMIKSYLPPFIKECGGVS